jgi:hypothetical protein
MVKAVKTLLYTGRDAPELAGRATTMVGKPPGIDGGKVTVRGDGRPDWVTVMLLSAGVCEPVALVTALLIPPVDTPVGPGTTAMTVPVPADAVGGSVMNLVVESELSVIVAEVKGPVNAG